MKINNYSNNNLIFAKNKSKKSEDEVIKEYSKTHFPSPITSIATYIVTLEAMSIASKKIPPQGIFIPIVIGGIGTGIDMYAGKQINQNNEKNKQKNQMTYDACISGVIAPAIFYTMDKIKEPRNINEKNIKSWAKPKIMLPVPILGAVCGVIGGNYSEKLYKKYFKLKDD